MCIVMKLHLPKSLRANLFACLSFIVGCTLYSGSMASADVLSLGRENTLTIDYADPESIMDLENGALQLDGNAKLLLSNCREGDGRTYTLLNGVSSLLDAEGNVIHLDDSNNAVSHYFDATQPGTGFWADATLSLTEDGTLQLVRHHETVKAAQTITTRQTETLVYNYYEGISFEDIDNNTSSDAFGGAIYGGENSTITLSGNGSVTFSGNTVSSSDSSSYSYACGGAIAVVSGTITLSGNGSVEFSGNTASSSSAASAFAYGGAIAGVTITLSGNGSVTFSGNTASSSTAARGGAIDGDTITLSDNGSVTFSGNTASSSSSSYSSYAYGGAIYGDYDSTITLSDNGSVTFSGNTASSSTSVARGGAIYSSTITLSGNGSVTFSGNTASSSSYSYYSSYASGGAIYSNGIVTITGNDEVTFAQNVEKNRTAYRLRSLYLLGNKLTLSAGEKQSIRFYDSVYMGASGSVALNADYTDAEGATQKSTGTILFSGATTEDDLKAAKGGVAGTEAEILNSRTSEIKSAATLYGGTLQVQDKAVLKLNGGLTVADGSKASVQVQAAELSVGSHALNMVSGSSLELSDGAKLTATELTITTGATLAVRGSVSTAQLTEQVSALTLSEETVAGFDASRAVNTGSVSVLEGDLTLEGGSLLSFEDAYLELTGDLIFDVAAGDEKIELDIAPGILSDSGSQVVLFNVGGVVTFTFDGLTASAEDGLVYRVQAMDYFFGSSLKDTTELVYDSANKVVYLVNMGAVSVPEPTTATLSLLALAALAARRRRK